MTVPGFIQRKIDQYKAEEEKFETDMKKEEIEKAKKEPATMAIHLSGVLHWEKGEPRLDKTPILPFLENLKGQEVVISIGQQEVFENQD